MTMHACLHARRDIARARPMQSVSRAPRLIERIKIETRWILLTTSLIDTANNPAARESLIATWRAIRNASLPIDDRKFYAIAAEHAATFAGAILARRNKNGNGCGL